LPDRRRKPGGDPRRARTFVVVSRQSVSAPRRQLTDFVGTLSPRKIAELNTALRIALDLP
jgi:mRNA-degrading endonuclease toxin of MazEF toxin-antitoxin module